jgi:magnesium transporter
MHNAEVGLDHILLLQTSLHHYEYILSHCQPAYLSHLSVSFSFARGGTDKAILALSTVTIGVLPMQLVLGESDLSLCLRRIMLNCDAGLFSMNVHIPHNGEAEAPHKEPDGSESPFFWFIGIVITIFLVACSMVSLIRYWRWAARRKWAGVRGAEVPGLWDGYWGWK